ncbi:MAG: hypothetical protein K8S21_02360 [Gemmatimonadetes bacterium]|nr:hypothetical protein [Gemmatimonadota bacterium]
MTPKSRITLLPTRRGDPRVSVAAFVVQLVVIGIVVPTLVVPVAFELLRDSSGRAVMPERISFITAVPKGTGPSREAARDGGDGRAPATVPQPAAPPAAPVVAPSTVPSGVPTRTTPERAPAGGVGPLVGGGGPTQGIRPSFNDPRLWQQPTDVVEAPMVPMTRADSLQALLWATASAFVDSMNRATPEPGRAPGDWTFERKGKKYGIDPKMIRLGDFSIPTALLALLPMNNLQANPIGIERARKLSSMRSEIMEQAERAARDDDFYAAVRALRERKERERKEAAARQQGVQPAPPVSR